MDNQTHGFELDKYHLRILDYLSSSEGARVQPCHLWKDKVITNRNLLYQKIRELNEHGKVRIKKDPKDHRLIWVESTTVTPEPLISGWERHILEPIFTRYRVAARLGLHLFYLCINRSEGHKPRCLSLAKALGIRECVTHVIESCKDVSEREAIHKLRQVDIEIRQSYGSIAAAAFSLSHWVSVLTAQAQEMIDDDSRLSVSGGTSQFPLMKIPPSKRICDELKILTADASLWAYAKSTFEKWDEIIAANKESRTEKINTIGIKNRKDKYNRRIILFCDLLGMLAANFNVQHAQSFGLSTFFDKRISISDLNFEESAKEILVRKLGQVSIIAGSNTFENITRENKKLKVETNQHLSGTLTLKIINRMHFSNIAPLVEVRTWLMRNKEEEGWREIIPDIRFYEKDIRKQTLPSGENSGEAIIDAKIELDAPSEKGTYYLIYAFREETECKYLASSTYWKLVYPVWYDRCDLTDLTREQIEQIQKYGHTEALWLYEYGYAPTDLPADAISIIVK